MVSKCKEGSVQCFREDNQSPSFLTEKLDLIESPFLEKIAMKILEKCLIFNVEDLSEKLDIFKELEILIN
jgi:hypothetical protein